MPDHIHGRGMSNTGTSLALTKGPAQRQGGAVPVLDRGSHYCCFIRSRS